MNNLQDFVFFSNATTTGNSNILYNTNYGSQIILEVQGTAATIQIDVFGIVDMNNSSDWSTLSAIKASTYTIVSQISESGIYIIPVDGVSKIYISIAAVSGGNVNVFGKLGE